MQAKCNTYCRASWRLLPLSAVTGSPLTVSQTTCNSPFPSSPTSSQRSPLILRMSEAGFLWCIQITLPLSQPLPTTCADGPGGALIWWHTWPYEVQGVLEVALWFGGVYTHRLIACSVFIFVFCNSLPLRFPSSFTDFGAIPIILFAPSVSTKQKYSTESQPFQNRYQIKSALTEVKYF